jgi:hypothetical protein
MEISRKDQIEFANEILALESSTTDPDQLTHLKKLASLLVSWTGIHGDDVAVNLSEYMYEVTVIARGEEDTGWKDEFKKKLYQEIKLDISDKETN